MDQVGETRRLAAILAADVVGYSRLMGADESGTLGALKAHLGELIEPVIATRHGRIVKTMGDGFLAEFASVVDAVQCAIEVQNAMPGRNTGVAQERRLEFRIGINVGDVIVEGEDIFGDGVNVAARLEGLARPGGICISRAARDQVRDKLSIDLEDLGEQSVKNIARPRISGAARGAGAGAGGRAGCAGVTRQALDRSAALRQHVGRSRAGVFLRRHRRGHHHRSVQSFGPVRRRPATPRSPTRANRPTSRRCARTSACARSWREACARPAIACASTPS